MARIVADEFLTLDGVAQAPGGAEEDQDGGFAHGGWHMPYNDERAGKWIQEGLDTADGFLLGRRTYEIFAAYWPVAPQEELAPARPLNSKPKYVVSATLSEPLAWQNSSLLKGDAPSAVRALRAQKAGDLHIIGSTRLVRLLIGEGLVDELRLILDPIAVGGGKRVFPDDGGLRKFQLKDSWATSTGAIVATYVVAD